MQINDLKGQVNDPLEEHIELSDPVCLIIKFGQEDVGYALLDEKAEKGIILLEFYLVNAHRKNTDLVFNKLVQVFHCSHWFVNSQDSFVLPIMLKNGFPYELDSFIFSVDKQKYENGYKTDEIVLNIANQNDVNNIYNLIMQDDFYTGNGLDALAVRIKNEEIYLLRSEGLLIGVGFVSPLVRTPLYADIAMIIERQYRRKGFASCLVSQLIEICFNKNLIPTALTSTTNIASRKTLENCGFYLDGCMLLAKIIKEV